MAKGQFLVLSKHFDKRNCEHHGEPEIAGQVLIENEAVGTLATANEISGTTTITYNGTAGDNSFDLAGWREIK